MTRRDFSVIVVIPGIMGTELRLQEVGPSKTVEKRVIWGEDLNVIWQSLAEHPQVLSSANIKAGKVLRYLTGFPFPFRKRRPLYGPLLEHLEKQYELTDGETLF